MAQRTIVTLPDKILKRKAHAVTKFDEELQVLIDDMIETMRAAPGVGLAAPQVAVPQRVIVVEYPENEEDEEAEPKLYALVNPEVVKASKETLIGVEGCLSIPNVVGEVERAQTVTVKGQNRHGQQVRLKLKDWTARIFQHEIDHINGTLFTDRATRVWVPEEPIEDRV